VFYYTNDVKALNFRTIITFILDLTCDKRVIAFYRVSILSPINLQMFIRLAFLS